MGQFHIDVFFSCPRTPAPHKFAYNRVLSLQEISPTLICTEGYRWIRWIADYTTYKMKFMNITKPRRMLKRKLLRPVVLFLIII